MKQKIVLLLLILGITACGKPDDPSAQSKPLGLYCSDPVTCLTFSDTQAHYIVFDLTNNCEKNNIIYNYSLDSGNIHLNPIDYHCSAICPSIPCPSTPGLATPESFFFSGNTVVISGVSYNKQN